MKTNQCVVPVWLMLLAIARGQAISCGQTPIAPTEENSDRIIGGRVAVPHSWPWQIELCKNTGIFGCNLLCGGALIDSQWVLTAAHCVFGSEENPSRFKVVVGVHRLSDGKEPSRETLGVERIFRHPNFTTVNDFSGSNDMALLKLTKPVTLGDEIQTVCLPKSDADVYVESNSAIVTGWGATGSSVFSPTSDLLKQVRLSFIKRSTCNAQHAPTNNPVDDTMICAGDPNIGSCYGDSGGPLVRKDPQRGRWYQYGVVSWGSKKCTQLPSVFARVSIFCDYIKASTGKDLCH